MLGLPLSKFPLHTYLFKVSYKTSPDNIVQRYMLASDFGEVEMRLQTSLEIPPEKILGAERLTNIIDLPPDLELVRKSSVKLGDGQHDGATMP